eukprot:CAMPEP_0201883508 /NCGR_PEP_ID=MMETSP0902-20130614/15868_1 /ASSEMBLY_ACC=CAM_ASM_000551 /TAXON_ID=420261 /ORGANISM="Thalassiosira antarctica, Strain CCMP982" /LENGTH=451 /DNA_ID=CAMNT_0048412317 /DNA_START=60 /DNA_END=1413 /DNA_ORIENTATION=+
MGSKLTGWSVIIVRWLIFIRLIDVLYASAFAPPRPQSLRHRNRLPTSTRLQPLSDSSDCSADENVININKLKQDLNDLSELRPPNPTGLWAQRNPDCSLPLAIVSAGSSYTRIWTHQTWSEHSYPPHIRYVRHLKRWHASTTARKVLPSVAFACAWSILLSSFAKIFYWSENPILPLKVAKKAAEWSAPTFSFLSAPLALLLTLRANASMARLLEARGAWGRLVLGTRTLSSVLKTYLYPVHPNGAVLSVRYLALLGWLLKAQLRGEDEDSQQQVTRLMLGEQQYNEEYDWLMGQPKRTVALTSRIRNICAVALASSIASSANHTDNPLDHTATQLLIEERIRELESCVGICERLFGSTIPPTYSRHLSRVLSLWILLLPVSLISSGVSTVAGVACATTVAAYVFIGLDEVGMEIENVFQIMPMQQLAAAAQKDAGDQFVSEMPTQQIIEH